MPVPSFGSPPDHCAKDRSSANMPANLIYKAQESSFAKII